MLPIAEVPIDPDALVACPARDFNVTYAAKACPKCTGFRGVAQMSSSDEKRWHERYVIRCEFVMERRTHILKIVE